MATDPREALGSHASGSSSQGHSGNGGRHGQLKQTISTLLRNFVVESDIKSTVELVDAYNRTEESGEREALQEWLRLYVKWFKDRKDADVTDGAFDEYASLVRIAAREPEDKRLVRDVLSSLVTRVERKATDTGYSISALSNAFQVVDEDVFSEDSTTLFSAASVLLSKLDPSKTAFERATSTTHETTLLALHQALLLIHHVAPNELNPNQQGFCQNAKTRLDEIGSHCSHFPITFQVETAKQSLKRLSGTESIDALPALMQCITGLLDLYSGVRRAIAADVDVKALERNYPAMKEVYTNLRNKTKDWYGALMELYCAAGLCHTDASAYSDFVESFESLMKDQFELDSFGDRKLLAFGVVLQLQMLATSHTLESLRAKAADEIVQLALTYTLCDNCDGDPSIVEALLDALLAICVDGACREDAEQTLRAIVDDQNTQAGDIPHTLHVADVCIGEAVKHWLASQTLDAKLREARACRRWRDGAELFHIVRRIIGVNYTKEDAIDKENALRERYQTPEFAQVTIFHAFVVYESEIDFEGLDVVR